MLIVADSALLLPSHVLSLLGGTGYSVVGEDPTRKHGILAKLRDLERQ
jgi:hypothetical protein